MSLHKTTLVCLYLASAIVVGYFLVTGWEYFSLPLMLRPRAEMHHSLKPSGTIGHTLGIVGSTLLISLFVYSLRKRRKFGLRKGRLSRWLDVHIWMGITGPALITLHSAFKFHGIVNISYFSMLAVMLSGFVGRYIYIQIPRDNQGIALSTQSIDERVAELTVEMVEKYGVGWDVLRALDERFPTRVTRSPGKLAALVDLFRFDIALPLLKFRIRRYLASRNTNTPKGMIAEVVNLTVQRARLHRRMLLLETMNKTLHLWHVIHKPFAYVMIIIMIVHVVVVISMGYTWVL